MIKNNNKVKVLFILLFFVLLSAFFVYLQKTDSRTVITNSDTGSNIPGSDFSKYSTLVKTGEEKNGDDRVWYNLYNQGDAVIDVEYNATLPLNKEDPTYPNFQHLYFYESGEKRLLPNKLNSAIIINGEEGTTSSFVNLDNYTDKKGWCFLGTATIRVKNYKEILVETQAFNKVDLVEILNNKPFADNKIVCQ